MKKKNFADRPLKSFSPLPTYTVLLFHPFGVISNFHTLYVIGRDFFLLQQLEKHHIIHIPIVPVDHPLDEKIPFTPEKIQIYLSFIRFWTRPMAMLSKRIGIFKAALIGKHWMVLFRNLYKFAAQVYRFRLTTTKRPDLKNLKDFRVIYRTDPHYMCVPSLHVATVALVYGFYRKFFCIEDITDEERKNWLTEIYADGLQIVETVLYVKQHSVNCISAALYMVTANYNDLFNEEDARLFIKALFSNPQGFSAEDAREIRNYVMEAYDKYVEEGAKAQNWYDPVQEFLLTYEK